MMKRFLQLSVALNLILAGFALWRTSHAALPPRATRTQVETPVSQSPQSRPIGSILTSRSAKSLWQQIDSADVAGFIANLRAAGCPEQTIRDIVVLRVCRSYFARLQQMEFERAQQGDYRGWSKNGEWRDGVYAQRDLRNEMISTLESALGEPWNKLSASVLGWPERGPDPMEGFSLEQRKLVRELNTRYDREEGELAWNKLTGDLSVEDDARLRQLKRQQREELARILSPQQLEEYLYRDSPAADYVRRSLPQSGSEQEFRTAVRLADEMDLYYTGGQELGRSDADFSTAFTQRKASFDKRLMDALGEHRIAQQQEQQQADTDAEQQRESAERDEQVHSDMVGALTKSGATADEAERFISKLKELQSTSGPRFEAMQKNLTGTPEEKEKFMKAAVVAELNQIATEIMGARGSGIVDQFVNEMDRREGH